MTRRIVRAMTAIIKLAHASEPCCDRLDGQGSCCVPGSTTGWAWRTTNIRIDVAVRPTA